MSNESKKEPEDIFAEIGENKSSDILSSSNQEKGAKSKIKQESIKEKKEKSQEVSKGFFNFSLKRVDWKYIVILFLIGLILDGIIILYSIQKLDFQSDIKVNFSHEKISQQISSPKQENINTKIVDTDGDGLSDKEENRLGTYILETDSDEDGLFDREEVKVYHTDPLNPDSDEDGLLDGAEIKQALDPNDSDPNAQLLNIKNAINK